MTNDIWEMPKPATVLEAIEEWRSIDLRTAAPEQIIGRMKAFRDKVQFGVVQVNSSSPPKLWRVRPRRRGESFDALGDLWEPPVGKPGLGRCNQAGSPLLYCSKDLATALDECEVTTGEELLLVRYATARTLRLSRIVGDFDPRQDGVSSMFDEDGLNAYRILREFFRSEFTKPVGKGTEWLYMISAAVCEVWAASHDADGWLYPSVRSPGEGNDNIALFPASAHAKLRIESAVWAIAEDVSASELKLGGSPLVLPGIRLRHLKIADVGELGLHWRQLAPGQFAIRR
jgi:hypothetical protein